MKNRAKGIKGSLTRKIGPLPVWLWAGLLFVGVWYYRNKLSAASDSGTGTGSVGPTPQTPQPGQVLQPGESYYDPNSGTLSTAPGGGGDSGNPPDYSGLAQAIQDAITAAENNNNGNQPGSNNPNPPPANGRHHKHNRGKNDKRTNKGKKNHHKPPVKTTGNKKPGDKKRHRGSATTRKIRTRVKVSPLTKPNSGRHRGGAKPNASSGKWGSAFSRTRYGLLGKPNVRQRPEANTQRVKPATSHAPRPSSPPPRTTRTHTAGGGRRRGR